MSALVLIGWLAIVAVAIWLTACTLYTGFCASVGWVGRTMPLAFFIVATGLWFAACKLAPFTIAWSFRP